MDQQSQSAQKLVPLPGMVPSTAANEPQQRQRLASFAGKATILKKTLSRTNTAVDLDMLQETRDSALLAPPASQSVQRAKRRLQLYVETQASLKTGLEDLRMMAGLSADALEESARAVQEPAFVVLPSSRLSKATDIIQVLLLLYVSFMVPLRFGFSLDLRVGEAMWWWELVVDAYFCFVRHQHCCLPSAPGMRARTRAYKHALLCPHGLLATTHWLCLALMSSVAFDAVPLNNPGCL